MSFLNKKYRFYTHRLVAEYYLRHINQKEVVNHLDGNKKNNHYKNLQICSQSENVKHAHETGLICERKNKNLSLDITGEIWRQIDGFCDYYCSNYGRIKGFKNNKEKILSPSIVNSYYKIFLSKNGISYGFLVHRIIYSTFYNDKNLDGYVIDHIDNNPSNNKIDNLQKITRRQNAIKDLKNDTTIVAFNRSGDFIGEYRSCRAAAKALNCNPYSVSLVCRGVYSYTHNFVFFYKGSTTIPKRK